MKLQPCRDCEAEVSPNAKTCPKCGCNNPTGKPETPILAQLLIVGVVATIAIGIVSALHERNTPSPAARQMQQFADDANASLRPDPEAAAKRAK